MLMMDRFPRDIEKLGKMDRNELISAYIELQGQTRQDNDLTDQQAAEIREHGWQRRKGYAALTEWAAGALDERWRSPPMITL